VSQRFPGANQAAVDNVSLLVEPGSLVVLLGPSGSGKTTLLKMVNRLYEPTSGRVLINGRDARSLPAPQLRRGIGYVIQQAGLFPHLRVGDNVAVVPRLLKWDKARIATRVDDLLDLVGLPAAEYRRRYPAQLSGGEQQRVGLARALAANPSTLLMDEPFGALDAITRARLQEELARLHARFGKTILFVTHDIEEAVRLADKIVVMRDGRMIQYDTALRIIMQPADASVADLVGAGDVLRRLSLVSVAASVQPLQRTAASSEPTVPRTARLRTVLALLIESGAPRVVVVDEDGRPIGQVDLPAIQAASRVRTSTAESGNARPTGALAPVGTQA
jgi:osmoprotectant transport system ATP-binding protein